MHDITPMRPYLFKAFFDWCVDNQLNPHINIQTDYPGVDIPVQFTAQPKLTLCIRPDAVMHYFQDEIGISFNTRFNTVPCQLYIPFGAINEIFSKTIGTILPFAPEPCYVQEYLDSKTPLVSEKSTTTMPPRVRGKPTLTLVK
jgi:Stringent starvation protein B